MLKTKKFKVAKNKIVTFCVCMMAGTAAYALPFSITPRAGTTLPMTISPGGTVTAYYTVVNSTGITRVANFVKYLPANVTQITTGGTFADTCAATFTLAPGASCTLQLSINGPVDPNSPNPQDRLFVCTQGGLACAGPSPDNTLNVTVVTPSVYATNFSSSVLNLCVLNPDGSFSSCTSTGSGFSSPIGASFTAAGNTLYVVNYGNAGVLNGSVSLCQLAATGAASNCTTTLGSLPGPAMLVKNPLTNFVYISNFNAYAASLSGPNVTFCQSNSVDGSLTNCGSAYDTGTILGISGMAINNAGNTIYLSVSTFATAPADRIFVCPLQANGVINPTCTPFQDSSFSGVRGIRLNAAGTYLYVANLAGDTVSTCPVSPATGAISNPCVSNPGFANPYDITFTTDGTHAYISNTDATAPSVSYCNVSATDGTLSGCVNASNGAGFVQPTGVLFR